MTDFESLASGELPETKLYIFSRQGAEFSEAAIKLKEGLISTPIAQIAFTTVKISSDAITNYLKAKQILEPQPHSPKIVPEINIEENMAEVDQQNLFLGLLVDNLNEPGNKIFPLQTRFDITEEAVSVGHLKGFVTSEIFDKLCVHENNQTPRFVIGQNDGTGNYREFSSLTCLEEDRDMFKNAIIKSLFALERALKYLKSRRPDTSPGFGPGGHENV